MKAKAKNNLLDVDLCFAGVASCCGLCVPNMIVTKANAKENLGEFVCLSIATAKTNLQIFICNRFRADGNALHSNRIC